MQPSGTTEPSEKDIVFQCKHCATPFVVDAAAAGLTVPCQNCGEQIIVPGRLVEQTAADAAKVADLKHQLKENESQRTEITGYINQLNIQLHRWQLRIQSLNERQKKLQAELDQICGPSAR
jgi:predicted Zn finger-like uncharacterized protein